MVRREDFKVVVYFFIYRSRSDRSNGVWSGRRKSAMTLG